MQVRAAGTRTIAKENARKRKPLCPLNIYQGLPAAERLQPGDVDERKVGDDEAIKDAVEKAKNADGEDLCWTSEMRADVAFQWRCW